MRGRLHAPRIGHMHNKHLYAVSGLLFLASVATFVYAFDVTKSDVPSSLSTSANHPNISIPEIKMPVNSTSAAQKIAEAHKPGERVVKVEAVQNNNQLAYQVVFSDGSKVEISAEDGSVVSEAEVNEPLNQPASGGTVPEETQPTTDEQPPIEEEPAESPEETPSSQAEEPSPEPAV
jgi:hypothetical protein